MTEQSPRGASNGMAALVPHAARQGRALSTSMALAGSAVFISTNTSSPAADLHVGQDASGGARGVVFATRQREALVLGWPRRFPRRQLSSPGRDKLLQPVMDWSDEVWRRAVLVEFVLSHLQKAAREQHARLRPS